MNILFTGFLFDGFHGSMIHIMEMAEYFVEQGHYVEVVSVCIKEEIQKSLKSKKINLINAVNIQLNKTYDIVFAYHWPIFPFLLKKGLQYKRLVLGCLSGFETLETPLLFYDYCFIQVHSDILKEKLINYYNIQEDKILVCENWLPDQFYNFSFPPPPPSKESTIPHSSEIDPFKIAVISNHPPKEIELLPTYLKDAVIDFWGMEQENYGLITPEILSQYHAIISIGKTVQYALGMGIPVYNYDIFGGSGWLTRHNIRQEEQHNFSGRFTKRKLSSLQIAKELKDGFSFAALEAKELRFYIKSKSLLSDQMNILIEKINQKPCASLIDNESHKLFCLYADSMVRWCFYFFSRCEKKNKFIFEVEKRRLQKRKTLYEKCAFFIFWRKEHYKKKIIKINNLLEKISEQEYKF